MILRLFGVKHILKVYHHLTCSLLHISSEFETWGKYSVLPKAGTWLPDCQAPTPISSGNFSLASSQGMEHTGIEEKLCFLS